MNARSQSKPKATSMRDMPIGAVVFVLTAMDDETTHEVRETYYTKVSEDKYLHHGCIQGDPILMAESEEEDRRPRYVNMVFPEGFEYPMIATLPVFPIAESRFAQFFPRGAGTPV